jgi:AcrR family transcriptional regulator
MRHDGGEDRRVRRTKRRLRDALATLVHEKPLHAVAVKEILARADVGRSTFYAHFRDKEALLASAIRHTLGAGEADGPSRPAASADDLLRFSLPLFEHVERRIDDFTLRVDMPARAALHEHLRRELAEVIEDRLRRARRGHPGEESVVPPELVARHVAATFLLVLDWWAERRPRLAAREADARFRALVLPALAAVPPRPGTSAPRAVEG